MGKSAIHLVIILGNAIIAGPEVLAEPVETNYFVAWSSIVLMHISAQILFRQRFANDILLMKAKISFG